VSGRTIDRMVAAGTAPPVTRLPSGWRRRQKRPAPVARRAPRARV